MANNELAIRFTEGKYATKSEVGKELKMSLIDNIWSNILSYRSSFNRYLTIKSIEKNQLIACFCPSISSLANGVEMKLVRTLREYTILGGNSQQANEFEVSCQVKALKCLAKEYDLDVSDNYLRSLVRGDIREVSSNLKTLARYLNALRYVKKMYANPVDEDFLAILYSKLTDNDELTTFYRTKEDTNRENRVLIDRVYTCAPVSLIEPMMNSLFNFIASSNMNSSCKAAIAYYYVSYIKPFPTYSDEIALLIAKAILAHNDLADLGALVPVESLLSENQEEIAKIFVEVQKTSDTTYFINYFLKLLESKCEELLDYVANAKASLYKQDLYQADTPVLNPAPTVQKVEQQDIFKASEEPVQQYVSISEPKPVEVTKPVVEEKPQVEKEVKVSEPAPEVKVEEVVREQIAVSYIPPAIDEREACRLEQHLLELDPSLRKHEAHFYARHCTLGKSYTIAQYKRMTGCVYETARTAMDHLVELGYYRKDSSSKKFIYTPIPRK